MPLSDYNFSQFLPPIAKYAKGKRASFDTSPVNDMPAGTFRDRISVLDMPKPPEFINSQVNMDGDYVDEVNQLLAPKAGVNTAGNRNVEKEGRDRGWLTGAVALLSMLAGKGEDVGLNSAAALKGAQTAQDNEYSKNVASDKAANDAIFKRLSANTQAIRARMEMDRLRDSGIKMRNDTAQQGFDNALKLRQLQGGEAYKEFQLAQQSKSAKDPRQVAMDEKAKALLAIATNPEKARYYPGGLPAIIREIDLINKERGLTNPLPDVLANPLPMSPGEAKRAAQTDQRISQADKNITLAEKRLEQGYTRIELQKRQQAIARANAQQTRGMNALRAMGMQDTVAKGFSKEHGELLTLDQEAKRLAAITAKTLDAKGNPFGPDRAGQARIQAQRLNERFVHKLMGLRERVESRGGMLTGDLDLLSPKQAREYRRELEKRMKIKQIQ